MPNPLEIGGIGSFMNHKDSSLHSQTVAWAFANQNTISNSSSLASHARQVSISASLEVGASIGIAILIKLSAPLI